MSIEAIIYQGREALRRKGGIPGNILTSVADWQVFSNCLTCDKYSTQTSQLYHTHTVDSFVTSLATRRYCVLPYYIIHKSMPTPTLGLAYCGPFCSHNCHTKGGSNIFQTTLPAYRRAIYPQGMTSENCLGGRLPCDLPLICALCPQWLSRDWYSSCVISHATAIKQHIPHCMVMEECLYLSTQYKNVIRANYIKTLHIEISKCIWL